MPVILIITLLITAASGVRLAKGGGGSYANSSSSNSTSTPSSPDSPPPDSHWFTTISQAEADVYRTAEYNKQWGLEAIHAAEAYAVLNKNGKAVGGDGIKIGISDGDGVEITHPDIAANDGGNHASIQGSSPPTYLGTMQPGEHGTNVASIAAGVKGNGDNTMHGVAFNSKIISVQAFGGNSNVFNQSNSLQSLVYAASQGAKVINASWAWSGDVATNHPDGLNEVKYFMDQVKAKDSLVTVASGNDGLANPALFGGYASDPDIQGYMIVVSGVGELQMGNGTRVQVSGFNKCGTSKDFCLVAPGIGIYAAAPNDSYAFLNGTSMAAPYVAGAAAVLRAAWPNLSASQVTKILLQTATDMLGYTNGNTQIGAPGVDDVYGHGLLNLYAAVQAQGQNLIPSSSTSLTTIGYDVRNSSINTSPIFGDAFTANVAPLLNSAVFFDDFGRDYKAFLGDRISSKTTRNFISPENILFNNVTIRSIPLNFGKNSTSHLTINLSDYQNKTAANYLGLKFAVIDHSRDPQANFNQGFSFTHNADNILPNTNFGLAFNVDTISAIEERDFGNFGFISANNFASNPYQSFIQGTSSNLQSSRKFNQFFVNHDIFAKKLALRFSHQTSYESSNLISQTNNKQNQISDFALSLKTEKKGSFLLSFGQLTEFNNNLLDSKALGTFESSGNVKTSYIKILSRQNLLKNLYFISSFSEGISNINGNNQGIFRAFNNVRSRSSSAALIYDNFMKGKIGAVYSEPLRVYHGQVSFDIPIGLDNNGNIIRYQGSASLVPQGKERNTELFYSKNLDQYSELKFTFLTQQERGNIKDTKTNHIGFISYHKEL